MRAQRQAGCPEGPLKNYLISKYLGTYFKNLSKMIVSTYLPETAPSSKPFSYAEALDAAMVAIKAQTQAVAMLTGAAAGRRDARHRVETEPAVTTAAPGRSPVIGLITSPTI